MGRIVSDIRDLIGDTPMLRLVKLGVPVGVELFAKLEFMNPGGSVKDRIGLALLEAAEQSGQLAPGGTVIEPTAGNTGIGLALAALGRGYQVIFTVPERFSQEKQELMRALGAQVVQTPTEAGMEGAIRRARELAAATPGAFVPQQFANPVNPRAHYESTGPEIWRDLEGRLDVFVAGIGSGGTFTGVARFLKHHSPGVRCVAVEPEGSVLGGGKPGPHKTEGIGMEKIHPIIDTSLMDAIYTVRDEDAFATVAELARREGVLAGSSAGAAVWAALREAERAQPGTRLCVVLPDSSERYLSKQIYQGGI